MLPRLDYFTGRKVTSVKQHDDEWTIYLDGGVKITNHDEDRPKPEESLKDFHLATAVTGTTTTLVFEKHGPNGVMEQRVSVDLTPNEYSLESPDHNDGEPVYPQRSDAEQQEIEDARPEEPSDRLQEGVESPQDAENDEEG